MKKPNRVARKGDAAPQGAQSNKLVTNTDLTVENEIASCETGYTEEQRLYRTSHGYVLTTEFTEVLDRRAWIRAHEWRLKKDPSLSPLEMRRFEPFELLPRKRLRLRSVSLKITRDQAVQWLDKNVIENAIPREFQDSFRPRSTDSRKLNASLALLKREIRRVKRIAKRDGKTTKRPAAIDYRHWLCLLLGLPGEADDAAISARAKEVI